MATLGTRATFVRFPIRTEDSDDRPMNYDVNTAGAWAGCTAPANAPPCRRRRGLQSGAGANASASGGATCRRRQPPATPSQGSFSDLVGVLPFVRWYLRGPARCSGRAPAVVGRHRPSSGAAPAVGGTGRRPPLAGRKGAAWGVRFGAAAAAADEQQVGTLFRGIAGVYLWCILSQGSRLKGSAIHGILFFVSGNRVV